MNQYIAYFDLLGYKDFILNNTHEEAKRRTLHNLRDIELALGQGKTIRLEKGGVISDLSKTTINCLNISDTIIFWTSDTSLKSLIEILEVTFLFNMQGVVYFFPLRGTLIYGEFETIPYDYKNQLNTTYRVNPIFGKGLIHAHIKAESLNWAGSVIDESVIKTIVSQGYNPNELLDKYAIKYLVPYKNSCCKTNLEFAFRLANDTLNKESFINTKKSIEQNFARDNKDATSKRARTILKNTLAFLSIVKKS